MGDGLNTLHGYSPRLILNGFPKSGLHLAELMTRCLLRPFLFENWIGSISEGAWGLGFSGVERSIRLLELMAGGTYVKGHIGYHPEFVQVMGTGVIGMIFVFRDPRDVLCSILRHIEQENGQQYIHPGRDLLLQLEIKEDRLIALLDGYAMFGGLFDRWKMYAPWLEEENVLPLPYEFMRYYPQQASRLMTRYILGRAAIPNGVFPVLCEEDFSRHVALMCEVMKQTQHSATFVKGSLGGWQEDFTPRVKSAFKDVAGDWLQTLGYETGKDW